MQVGLQIFILLLDVWVSILDPKKSQWEVTFTSGSSIPSCHFLNQLGTFTTASNANQFIIGASSQIINVISQTNSAHSDHLSKK